MPLSLVQMCPIYWPNFGCYPPVLSDSQKIFCVCTRIPDVKVTSDVCTVDLSSGTGHPLGQKKTSMWPKYGPDFILLPAAVLIFSFPE